MNYIPRKGISGKEKPFYDNIRKNYEIAHLLGLYKKLGNHQKVRFQDSIMNQLSHNFAFRGGSIG